MSINLVDSCGWLEYFAEGGNVEFYADVIEGTNNLIVPSLCCAEVFKVLLREKGESIALSAISAMRQGKIIDLDIKLAMEAAKVGVYLKLSLADSIIYATAKSQEALLWTQDKHFENLPDVKYTPKRDF
jgi:predicted nucleic acid-binding protein